MHSEQDYQRQSPNSHPHPGSLPGSHPGSRHDSLGASDAPSILAIAEYLQAQQQQQAQLHAAAAQHQHHQSQLHPGPIDLTIPGATGPSITLEQLSNLQHHFRSGHNQQQQQSSEMYDGSLLGSMLQQQHYHHHLNGPPSPGSPIPQSGGTYRNVSPAQSVYGGNGGSGTMSPTKKLSKPLIEKRRRDRINRCLRLLKELVIDSKRFPVANMNKSRFEKADILEITVKYLMMVQQEERRIYQAGFSACHAEITKLVQELTETTSKDQQEAVTPKETDEAMVVVHDEDETTLEEAPVAGKASAPATGADLNLVSQLCARLAELGEQISAEQAIQQQRTASLTNLVLELNEIKSRSASITSDHSGEVTPTSLGPREHRSPSIEDLLLLDGMRIYDADEEPSTLMLKQYISRQNSSGNSAVAGPGVGGVIRHTSNYHPDASHQQHHGKPLTPNSPWAHQLLLEQQQKQQLQQQSSSGYHHRSSSLSTAKSSSSSASSASSSSSSSGSSTNSTSATSFFKPGQQTAVDPSCINWTPGPFFTELTMSVTGNERNSGTISSYESIWRPWGFNGS